MNNKIYDVHVVCEALAIDAVISAGLKVDWSIEDSIYDELKNLVREATYDMLYKLEVEDWVVPRGWFSSYEDLQSEIHEDVQQKIEKHFRDVTLSLHVDAPEFPDEKINAACIICSIVDDDYDCQQGTINTGCIISRSLQACVKEGEWCCGLTEASEDRWIDCSLTDVSKWPAPIVENGKVKWIVDDKEYRGMLWFTAGYDDPTATWCLHGMNDAWKENWFEVDDYDNWDHYVDDVDDYFYIWLSVECGECPPSLDAVIDKCPVHFSPDTDSEELQQRIDAYCLQMQQNRLM